MQTHTKEHHCIGPEQPTLNIRVDLKCVIWIDHVSRKLGLRLLQGKRRARTSEPVVPTTIEGKTKNGIEACWT